jgi:hypothetical protein
MTRLFRRGDIDEVVPVSPGAPRAGCIRAAWTASGADAPRPMTLQASFNGGAFNVFSGKYTLGFRAEGVLRRSEFGLDEHLPAVGDEIELEIHAEFQRTP